MKNYGNKWVEYATNGDMHIEILFINIYNSNLLNPAKFHNYQHLGPYILRKFIVCAIISGSAICFIYLCFLKFKGFFLIFPTFCNANIYPTPPPCLWCQDLTLLRLNHLKLPVFLDRLVLRREYCLAIRICQYLKIPDAEGASRIVAHWACYKVIYVSQWACYKLIYVTQWARYKVMYVAHWK